MTADSCVNITPSAPPTQAYYPKPGSRGLAQKEKQLHADPWEGRLFLRTQARFLSVNQVCRDKATVFICVTSVIRKQMLDELCCS